MLKIKPQDLTEGMMVAEPILDIKGKVLLQAKALLSQKHIDLLQSWDIDFIRIREVNDTDASIERELREENAGRAAQVDRAIREKIGINEQEIILILKGLDTNGEIPEWAPERRSADAPGTLVTAEGVRYFYKFLNIISRLLENGVRNRDFSVKEINEVSRYVSDYVRMTSGVIGYTLKPLQIECGELTRHTLGTAVIAGKIAMLLNYGERDLQNVILAALFHDIGKLGMVPSIANPAGKLAADEEKVYQSHVALGLGRLKGKTWIPKEVLLAVAQHHERMDGTGFPVGFSGEKIHPYARILAIADFFDSLMHGRKPVSLPTALKQLQEVQGKFDPVICMIFKAYLQDFLLSNNVELEDGRLAQVIYMHQTFKEPVVKTNDGQFIDLNKDHEIKIERYTM